MTPPIHVPPVLPLQHRLLMIEDDHRLAAMVVTYLQLNGFAVEHVETARDGLARLQSARPFSAILLDLMLPDANGLDLCREIRHLPQPRGSIPILMLTAKGDPMDRVVGLEIGADDYVPKPFEPRELLARLRAILRRPAQQMTAPSSLLHFGRLAIDRDARTVRIDQRNCVLTAYQFDLLQALAERAGRVLSREQLMDAVSGVPLDAFDRSIDVHVGRVRQAIEDDPKHPKRILTVRGSGYLFAKVQDA